MTYKLYIDIDGVMGDIVAAIMRLYPKANLVNPKVYALNKMFDNVSVAIVKRSELYNADNFRLYPFVSQTLRSFERLGFEIEFVTARPYVLQSMTDITLNQIGLSQDREVIYGFDSTEEKLNYVVGDLILNPQIKQAWFIEDNPALVSALNTRSSPILENFNRLTLLMYLQTYNSSGYFWGSDTPIKPIMNWQHFYNKVIEGVGK